MHLIYRYYWNEAKDGKGRHLGFWGYKEGQPLSLVYEGQIEQQSHMSFEDLLNELFVTFNVDASRPKEYRGPSMSVGSVVTFESPKGRTIAYACENLGWKQVDISQSKIVVCDQKWIAIVGRMSQSETFFKLDRAVEYLVANGQNSDAADNVIRVMLQLYDEMSEVEKNKVAKKYPHFRANAVYMRDILLKGN